MFIDITKECVIQNNMKNDVRCVLKHTISSIKMINDNETFKKIRIFAANGTRWCQCLCNVTFIYSRLHQLKKKINRTALGNHCKFVSVVSGIFSHFWCTSLDSQGKSKKTYQIVKKTKPNEKYEKHTHTHRARMSITLIWFLVEFNESKIARKLLLRTMQNTMLAQVFGGNRNGIAFID